MLNTIDASQIRGARGMLGWSMLDLAKAAGVSVSTVKRMEMAEPISAEASVLVRTAIEAAGVCFVEGTDEGVGVLLRPR